MTALTLSRLPLAAGGAVVMSAGRFSLWTLARFMRAPLTNSALIAMVTLTALAGSNALYFQTGRHPAPMFAPAPDVPVSVSATPVVPTVRKTATPAKVVPAVPRSATTSTVAPAIPDGPVGNSDVYEVQKKLYELKLFQGTVDGYYGPMTARAIRAFEERNGMKPMGAVTPEVVDAIVNSNAEGKAAFVRPQAAVEPQAAPVVAMVMAPAADRVVARLPTIEPIDQLGEALSTVAETAAGSIDDMVAAVDGGRSTPTAPAIRPIPSQPIPQALPPPVQQLAMAQPAAMAPVEQTASVGQPAANADVSLTTKVQRGLSSLGFLHGPIDGHAGDATAKAIRNFEVYYNYDVTGQISPATGGHAVGGGRLHIVSRLRSDLWCAVFVRRHNDLGNMCVISRRGDPIAGQVFIEVDHLNGTVSLYTPAPAVNLNDANANLVFQRRLYRAEPEKVRARIAREADFDPDLWVLSLDLRGDDIGIERVD